MKEPPPPPLLLLLWQTRAKKVEPVEGGEISSSRGEGRDAPGRGRINAIRSGKTMSRSVFPLSLLAHAGLLGREREAQNARSACMPGVKLFPRAARGGVLSRFAKFRRWQKAGMNGSAWDAWVVGQLIVYAPFFPKNV